MAKSGGGGEGGGGGNTAAYFRVTSNIFGGAITNLSTAKTPDRHWRVASLLSS